MSLSQATLDGLATAIFGELGSLVETVTLSHQATQDATPTTYSLTAFVNEYSAREVHASETILQDDRRCRLKTAALSVVPTRWSTVTRSDASVWQVITVRGGANHPFSDLQLRRID